MCRKLGKRLITGCQRGSKEEQDQSKPSLHIKSLFRMPAGFRNTPLDGASMTTKTVNNTGAAQGMSDTKGYQRPKNHCYVPPSISVSERGQFSSHDVLPPQDRGGMCASSWVSPCLTTYDPPGPCFLCAALVTLHEDSDRLSTSLNSPHLSRQSAVTSGCVLCG